MAGDGADFFEVGANFAESGGLKHDGAIPGGGDFFADVFDIFGGENGDAGDFEGAGVGLNLRENIEDLFEGGIGEEEYAVGWGGFEFLEGIFGGGGKADLEAVFLEVFLDEGTAFFLAVDDKQSEVGADFDFEW